MNERDPYGFDLFLNLMSQDTNVDPDRLVKFAATIGQKEAGPGGDITTTQKGSGYGRGLFQYETGIHKNKGYSGKGSSQSFQTALTKLKNYYNVSGVEQPEWVQNLSKKTDPAKLSTEQQMMLFFADKNNFLKDKETGKLYLEKNYLEELNNPEFDAGDWWAKYHKRKLSAVSEKEKQAMNQYYNQMFASNPVSYDELAGVTGTGLENELLGRTDMYT